jgi:hypothetical protein
MPVLNVGNYEYTNGISYAINKSYVLINDSTIFPFLGDIFKINNYILSMGDILLYSGLTWYIIVLGLYIYNKISKKNMELKYEKIN